VLSQICITGILACTLPALSDPH